MAAVAGAVLVVGLGCGWILKTWSVSGKAVSAGARHSSTEFPSDGAARRGLASGEDETASLFLGRLHDVLGIRGSARRSRAILALADGLSPTQIRQCLALLEKTHLADRHEIRDLLLATLAESDPQGALDIALAVKSASERSGAVQAVIRSWAEDDAFAAEKWVAALPAGQLRDSATIALAVTVADSDFEHALRLVRLVPVAAWHWEVGHGNFDALYEKAVADDPAHALAVTAKSGRNPMLTVVALGMVGEEWAEGDLDGASRWIQSLSETELQKNGSAVSPIFQGWLKKDAVSATGWLAQLPDRAAKNSLLREFADSLDEWGLEPTTALSLAALIPPGFHQDDAVTSITQKWAERDPLAASAWALDQPDGQVRTDALQSVASKWLSIDPQRPRQNGLMRCRMTRRRVRFLAGPSGSSSMASSGVRWTRKTPWPCTCLRLCCATFLTGLARWMIPKKERKPMKPSPGSGCSAIDKPRRPGLTSRLCRRPRRIAFCGRRPARRSRRKRSPKRTLRHRSVTLLLMMNRERRRSPRSYESYKPMKSIHLFALTALFAGASSALAQKEGVVQCANVIYAGTKTSQCFSDAFLSTLQQKTTIVTERRFKPVKLDSSELFDFPFVVMTGEGAFRLQPAERENLAKYLATGGFLLASAGCSSGEWDESFRQELKTLLPEHPLHAIPMDHPIFRTVFAIERLDLAKSSGTASLDGIDINGRIVCVYSRHGLNDTHNSSGCCCCGGNEIRNSEEINVNIVAYALLH